MRIPSFIALAILAFGSFVAQAQVPLKIITTDQAGGGMDALIRPVAEKLSVALGRPVLVDNKPGAQGGIGGQAVVSSPPDGNTVLITVQAGIVINPRRRRRGSPRIASASAATSPGGPPALVGPPSVLTWMHTCNGGK